MLRPDDMIIGLLGFECVSPNKGCEALSYAFVDYLFNHFNGKIHKIYLWNTEAGMLGDLYPDIEFEYISPKVRDIKLKWIRSIIKCDYIFDVTMGDSFSDIYSITGCSYVLSRKRITRFFNHNYILMPQTYGPFLDKNNEAVAKEIINKSRIVISRDKKSVEYLRKIGITRRIEENIDLAFMLPYQKDLYTISRNKKNLGINVSGLLWRGGFEEKNQFNLSINYREYILSLLDYYSSSDEWQIHLIPHVIDKSEDAHDDDWSINAYLNEKYSSTVLAPCFNNPIEAKSYISCMDCFIGSRMHSTIAAISSGVAVIPVSYSRKFEGLYETFGYQYMIHGNDETTENALSKTIEYVSSYRELANKVSLCQTKIDFMKDKLRKDIESIMKS